MTILEFGKLYALYEDRLGSLFGGTEPSQILTVLGLCKDRATSQKELAKIFNVKQPAAAKLVAKLCAAEIDDAKLFSYTNRAKDGSKDLQLLPAGRSAVKRFEAALNAQLKHATVSAAQPSSSNRDRLGKGDTTLQSKQADKPRGGRKRYDIEGQLSLEPLFRAEA